MLMRCSWVKSRRVDLYIAIMSCLLAFAPSGELSEWISIWVVSHCNISILVMEQVPKIQFLVTWNLPKNGFKTSWSRLFFIFLPNILPYLKIFWSFAAPPVHSTLYIIKYGKALTKNEEKPCYICLQPIPQWTRNWKIVSPRLLLLHDLKTRINFLLLLFSFGYRNSKELLMQQYETTHFF